MHLDLSDATSERDRVPTAAATTLSASYRSARRHAGCTAPHATGCASEYAIRPASTSPAHQTIHQIQVQHSDPASEVPLAPVPHTQAPHAAHHAAKRPQSWQLTSRARKYRRSAALAGRGPRNASRGASAEHMPLSPFAVSIEGFFPLNISSTPAAELPPTRTSYMPSDPDGNFPPATVVLDACACFASPSSGRTSSK